jgi:tryptophan-rich sensory protein
MERTESGLADRGESMKVWEGEPDDLDADVLDGDDFGGLNGNDEIESTNDEERSTRSDALAIASFAALTVGAAAIGRAATGGSSGLWYRSLRKPPFQPPSWVFGPVWTLLYGLIATSGYRVWKSPPGKARTRALALWGTQLALNGAWTPLFFGAKRKRAAFVDLLALLGVVAAYTEVARKVDKPAAAIVLPYLGWLGFAGLLNEELIRRNRGWRSWLRR